MTDRDDLTPVDVDKLQADLVTLREKISSLEHSVRSARNDATVHGDALREMDVRMRGRDGDNGVMGRLSALERWKESHGREHAQIVQERRQAVERWGGRTWTLFASLLLLVVGLVVRDVYPDLRRASIQAPTAIGDAAFYRLERRLAEIMDTMGRLPAQPATGGAYRLQDGRPRTDWLERLAPQLGTITPAERDLAWEILQDGG